MTTQELYNKVLAEEVTQQKFLYEVRRDINLPFITSSNNFKDTVQILKNKGMISEKKLSTGKQEVEIYAKTIDMVNPYEYTRGMNYELDVVVDAMGNRIADNAGDSMHIEDLTKDDILKAQKKVLKNLTKNPQYYQQKLIPQMEGETEYAIEVTAKSIEALKKKAGKVIREHGEDYEAVSKVMGNVSQLEEDDKTQAYIMALDMYKNAKGTYDEKMALDNLEKAAKKAGINVDLDESLSFTERSEALKRALKRWRESKTPNEIKAAKENLVLISKDIGVDISVKDLDAIEKGVDEGISEYGAGVKEGDEIAAKKMAVKRESIYEKYAQKYGVDVNEVKDRLEAYKLKQEETIEVEDENTAISVQKKAPDADVRIIEK